MQDVHNLMLVRVPRLMRSLRHSWAGAMSISCQVFQ